MSMSQTQEVYSCVYVSDTRGIQLCLCLRHKRYTVVSNVSDTRGVQLCLCLRHKRCTVVSNVSDTRGIQLCLMSQRHVLETLKQWKQNQLLSQARWCSSKTPSSATTELCTCSHDVDQQGWLSVLLVEETGVPGVNHTPAGSH